MPNHPNVLIILTDDQGYGDLGCFGNTVLKTPNLDRLADDGITLRQHYTASPICAPARASFLTGMYNHRTGALSVESNRGNDRISTGVRLVSDYFKNAGYRTSMIGKWHNGTHELKHHPVNRGFDEFVGFLHGGSGYYNWNINYNFESRPADGRYLTDVFTDEAIQFLKRNRSNPFFLYLAYNAPHAPFEAPGQYIDYYRDLGTLDEGVCRVYAMLQAMDDGVGSILDCLKDLGLDENTVVLFTSDNGPLLGQRGSLNLKRYNGPFSGAKTEVLEGGIRVPAIVRWPAGLDENVFVDDMVHFTDWMPTLLEACGIDSQVEHQLDGRSCLSLLRGADPNRPGIRFWQYNRYDPVARCNAAMRDGNWKLYWQDIPEAMAKIPSDNEIYNEIMTHPGFRIMQLDNPSFERSIPEPGKPCLFNILDDPFEQKDLSGSEPAQLDKMILSLDNWFDRVNEERRGLVF